ncbi:lysophospholipid acyltransferase family protein [Enterobacteriaceae bacterium C23F]
MDIVDRVIAEFFPGRPVSPFKRRLIEWAIKNEEVSPLLDRLSQKKGLDWVASAIEALCLRTEIHPGDYHHIPDTGATIVIANHPTVVDGIAVINTVAMVRKDIKILANHLLQVAFPQVENITIGIRNMQGEFSRKQFKEISEHLKNGGVLIIFPAGKIASVSLTGLRESPWHHGFVQLARRFNAALVPVHVTGKNSFIYYLAATLWRPLSNLMLTRECLKHSGGTLRLKIGERIDLASDELSKQDADHTASLIKHHVLQMTKNVRNTLPVIAGIARAENRTLLIKALNQCKVLKKLSDGKVLYLYQRHDNAWSPVLNELGRLREACYRSIGAGTGSPRDNDSYDDHYSHVILWEPRDLEIVGAYRLTSAREQIDRFGLAGLYSHSLFNYDRSFIARLNESVEIGRGFVQCKYQKTNALSLLWQGIFCFLGDLKQYKYVLGVLSIPQSYPESAQNLIMAFYQTWSDEDDDICHPVNRYRLPDPSALGFFSGNDVAEDWEKLNNKLGYLGHPLPWPYKQATKWFKPGGSRVLCFIKDDHFHSIAALNFSEIDKLKRMYSMHFVARTEEPTVAEA